MYATLRPLIFRLDPERAHSLTVKILRLVGAAPPLARLVRAQFAAPAQPVRVFGLDFTNPVGLAAGYDKDGLAWRGLACLGFGHIEVGTITPRPQPGNPRPRVFRLPLDQAVINRMGFPGQGADFAVRQLRGPRPDGLVLGVNIGKNKDTPVEDAAQDYLRLLRVYALLADYLAVNVSSPNTVGLRRLQGREMLEALLAALANEREALRQTARQPGRLPILVKLAPDLSEEELEDALGAISAAGMDGVIATNTTLARPALQSGLDGETGGLSGAPLTVRSREFVARIVRLTDNRLPVIGVGGIMNGTDARAMLDAGACLVQIYTGMIYAGPGLPQAILRALASTART